jgi:DNA-binding MarR family transcriptional regulator
MPRAVPARPSVEETIVLVFFDLANELGKLGEEIAARAGLTTQQWLVLLQVAGDPNFVGPDTGLRSPARGVMASEIAEARGVSRANVSGLVCQLIRKGLVEQRAEPGDRRRKGLFVTTDGRAALASLEGVRRRANRALLADLSAGERRQLLGSLQRCLRRLWLAKDAGGFGAGG